uniref:H15 domain-containing protein n=1 Tax=Gouania willdenowi TaxID=441366 RepID=A0A8C5N2R9_GOUWI
MAEVAPLKDAKKRASKPKTALKKKKSSGPSVSDLILEAVAASKERRGLSLSALKKELAAKGYDVVRNRSRVNAAVRRLVENGKLLRTKGTGAAGTFKLAKSTESHHFVCQELVFPDHEINVIHLNILYHNIRTYSYIL